MGPPPRRFLTPLSNSPELSVRPPPGARRCARAGGRVQRRSTSQFKGDGEEEETAISSNVSLCKTSEKCRFISHCACVVKTANGNPQQYYFPNSSNGNSKIGFTH